MVDLLMNSYYDWILLTIFLFIDWKGVINSFKYYLKK